MMPASAEPLPFSLELSIVSVAEVSAAAAPATNESRLISSRWVTPISGRESKAASGSMVMLAALGRTSAACSSVRQGRVCTGTPDRYTVSKQSGNEWPGQGGACGECVRAHRTGTL